MAINHISVKVSGNPDSNSGFVPILLFNSPSFAVDDQFYVGFDNCSYFYTIKTTKVQTIYKLVKNNVRSYGATRAGSLVIAFSVPKNYTIDGGKTPYDVLEELKNEFLKKCMTCKDPVRETYEFNPGRIDLHVLDEVANKFTISPQPSPDRVMNPTAPIGYIVKSDIEIEKLFHDINYPEFDNYSEVIVAETVNQTSYIPINNIQIPRLKNYAIYVDGIYQIACTDVNQILTVSSGKSQEYFNNQSIQFSIQNLKDGDIFPGFDLQEIKERIDISTVGWATPKSRTIKIKIVPNEFEEYFFANRHLLKVTGTYGKIELNNNLSFTLVGEQIAEIKKGTIHFEIEQNGKYRLSKVNPAGDEFRVTVEEIKRLPNQNAQGAGLHKYPKQDKTTGLQPFINSPVYDVTISLKDKEIFKESDEIDLKLKTPSDNSYKTIASWRTVFMAKPKPNGEYEGHFYVPKVLSTPYLYLCFQANGKDYITKQALATNNDKVPVEEKDFAVSKVKPLYKKKNLIILMISYIICMFVGCCGYAAYDYIKNILDETKPSDETPVVTDGGEDLPSMNENDAKAFLTDADSVLKNKDLKLGDVVTFYNKYQTARTPIDNVDKKDFGKKVCGRIEDYYRVASCIQNGDLVGLEALNIDTLHIWSIHKDVVKEILKDDVTKGQFMDNYSNITGFADIEENLKTHGYDSGAPSTNQQNTGSRSVSSNRNSTTLQTSAKTTTKNKYWDCEECKKTGKPKYRYNDQEAYNNHLISHKER